MDVVLNLQSGDISKLPSAAGRFYGEIFNMADDPFMQGHFSVESDIPSDSEAPLLRSEDRGERSYGAFYSKASETIGFRVNELNWTQDQVNSLIGEFSDICERTENSMEELEMTAKKIRWIQIIRKVRTIPDFTPYSKRMTVIKRNILWILNIVEGSSRAVRYTPVILKNKKKSVTFVCMRMVVILGILRREFDSILETLPQEPTGDLLDLKTHLEGSIVCLSNSLQELKSVISKLKSLGTVTLKISSERPNDLLIDVEPIKEEPRKEIRYVINRLGRIILSVVITGTIFGAAGCLHVALTIMHDINARNALFSRLGQ